MSLCECNLARVLQGLERKGNRDIEVGQFFCEHPGAAKQIFSTLPSAVYSDAAEGGFIAALYFEGHEGIAGVINHS